MDEINCKMGVLGGLAKRDAFAFQNEKLSYPGPADYDGKGPGLHERLRLRYQSEMRTQDRSLNNLNSPNQS